jgi:hypothetical protein
MRACSAGVFLCAGRWPGLLSQLEFVFPLPFIQMDRVPAMVRRTLSLVMILLGAASIASARGSWAAEPRQATGQCYRYPRAAV